MILKENIMSDQECLIKLVVIEATSIHKKLLNRTGLRIVAL
jgi:hypothetical protein